MNLPFQSPAQRAALADTGLAIAAAAQSVAPLWPLEGAIAVNPLSGLEGQRFEDAVHQGAEIFGARTHLPLAQWRRLVEKGRLTRTAVAEVAIERLGGVDRAFQLLGPDLTLLDCVIARLFDLPEGPDRAIEADPAAQLIAKWCAAYFDQGVAALPMPGRNAGLLRAVAAMLPHDPDYRRLCVADGLDPREWADRDPVATVLAGLDLLEVAPDARFDFLRRLIGRLPGWAGHLRWRSEHADADVVAEAPGGIADLLALWLIVETGIFSVPRADPAPVERADAIATRLAAHFGIPTAEGGALLREAAAVPAHELGLIFQVAAERSYRDSVLAEMRWNARRQPAEARPDAQLVFCIDVRSEPMRRAIEAEGRFETFGYAGFFGLPIAIHRPNQPRARQLPVLVPPAHDVAMVDCCEGEATARERQSATARDLFAQLKGGVATAFATAEAGGMLGAARMMLSTAFPRVAARLALGWQGDDHAFAPAVHGHDGHTPIPFDARLAYARGLFALTGMSRTTARLIALIGHRGSTTNNPFGASLDCGACAGHGGAPNARALAAILNDPAIRAALADDGAIPDDSWFVAGEHDTTTDDIILFDLDQLPASHADDVARLQSALARAGAANRAVRAERLGRDAADLATGAAHWAEVRPEWGLTGNAAFIVAPRALTRNQDLGGRAFLHSYDWRQDEDGSALATILTAPMVVAQWINCQYLFSTLDNDRYGAGDKTVHNVVGRIGVVRGNGGDLCVGLPMQSLFEDDGTPAHLPQRLLTIVLAPLDRVEQVVDAHTVLQTLFDNGWVQLVAIDPVTGVQHRWKPRSARPADALPAPVRRATPRVDA